MLHILEIALNERCLRNGTNQICIIFMNIEWVMKTTLTMEVNVERHKKRVKGKEKRISRRAKHEKNNHKRKTR